ncbi:MAG: nitroreductase family protein [Alphaproteobacteria bacterium]|nr:nitroreductase family protein [Alphaproteobacteria bacterium]MCB9930422.1 nitroreductase family protein [Alphaproteobacteria bacterium]
MSVYDLAVTDALLSTTRAVRKRLDLSKPVPDQVIRECLELTLQAPTGSNRQGWRWVVVTDADKRAALADIYRKGAGAYLQESGEQAKAEGRAQDSRVYDSAQYLADHLHEVPVHVLPCIRADHVPENPPRRVWPGLMGSIMPAVWSFQLALRARGLGSALTTLHLAYESEAAALLGIPDGIMQVALLPVAYTIGTEFKPAKRPPLDSVLHWNQWDAGKD